MNPELSLRIGKPHIPAAELAYGTADGQPTGGRTGQNILLSIQLADTVGVPTGTPHHVRRG